MNTSHIISAISKKIDFLNNLTAMNSTETNLTRALNHSASEMSPIQNSHSNLGWLYLFITAAAVSLFAAAVYVLRQNAPDRRKEEYNAIELKGIVSEEQKTPQYNKMTLNEFYAHKDGTPPNIPPITPNNSNYYCKI